MSIFRVSKNQQKFVGNIYDGIFEKILYGKHFLKHFSVNEKKTTHNSKETNCVTS